MKDQINTIREALNLATDGPVIDRDGLMREALTALTQIEKMVGEQEPNKWEGGEGWESLAWGLCAEEHGEDACNDLIWEGGPVPEPWGDRWMKYEGEAKRLIALVHKYAAPTTQQYEAGDMASAAAQGFRDGVASVAQQPQAEAVPQFVSCRCFDDVSKRLCADKNRCSQVVAASAAPQQTEAVTKKDLMFSTVAMQTRHDERIERIVNSLEQVKQEQAERYQPVREAFWWRVRIGTGTQTIGRCYTETEAQRLAAELQRAFNDGAFCVEKVVCNGDLIGAAAPQQAEAVPPTHVSVPVEPDEMWAYRVIRHHQPNLDVGTKDWRKCLEEMLHWHAAIAAQGASHE